MSSMKDSGRDYVLEKPTEKTIPSGQLLWIRMLFSSFGDTVWTNRIASSSVWAITGEVMLLTSSDMGMSHGQTMEEVTVAPGTIFLILLRHVEALFRSDLA